MISQNKKSRAIHAALLLLLSCALVGAQEESGEKRSVDSLRREAANLSRQGRHAESNRILERAVNADPNNVRLLKDYMWALWHSNQHQRTVEIASRVLNLIKNDIEALNMVGRASEAVGNRYEAKRAYERSLDLQAKQLPITRALARVYYDLKEYDRAVKLYQEFIAQQPDDAAVHGAMGRIAFHQERFADSIIMYERAAELAPENPRYRFGKAQSLFYSGRVSEAMALLRELAQLKPTDWPSVQFLTAAAAVSKNYPLAYQTLEDNLREVGAPEEGILFQLIELYRDTGAVEKLRGAINRLLTMNPQHGPALLEKAQLVLDQGNAREAIATYQKVAQMNPESVFAWGGLAESFAASSQTARALDAIEQAYKLDPSDPDLVLRKANHMYQNGDRAGARTILVKWLGANEEKTLPIILYHGIIPNPGDPVLAVPTNISVAAFDSQMRALKEAGFTSITVQQAVDWFDGKADLPRKAILITFDDARLDSLINADPILKQNGFKAVMFAPIYNVAGNLPGFANWKELAAYQATGRWEIQAHGDKGHTYVQTDQAGRKGLFLPNRIWNENDKRMETDVEWEVRVKADHESSKELILKHLGKPAAVFAWPEGDYGQFGIPNVPQAVSKNLKSCAEVYSLCFTQNEFGLNNRSRERSRVFRYEPKNTQTGKALVAKIIDETPHIRIRRRLLLMAAWEGRPQEAYTWLRKNAAVVSSKSVLLADEAVIHRDMGNFAQGLAVARQAQALGDESAENLLLLESMTRRVQPDWNGTLSFFGDNQTRRDFKFRQSVGSFLWGGNMVRLSQFHGEHRQEFHETISDNGIGLVATRGLGLLHNVEVQIDDHLFSGRLPNTVGASAALRSQWTDMIGTEVTAGRVPYEISSALENNVQKGYGGLQVSWFRPDSWKGYLRGKLTNYTVISNNRYDGSIQLSHPISSGSNFRIIGQSSYEHAHRATPFYYSPQRVRLYELGLNYDGVIEKGVHLFASYLPGVGQEKGTTEKFVQIWDMSMKWDYTQDFAINPSFWIADSPTYNSTYFEIQVIYKFKNTRDGGLSR